MGSWWAPFLVVWTSLTLYRILEDCPLVVPIGPPALAALTGHCPWFFRSPQPLHSNVYCLRGSHYHSGEWHGGRATSIYKFPQAVFSSQWVMNLFFLFAVLEQLLTHCPVPVLEYPENPTLPWLQFYSAPTHCSLIWKSFNFTLLISLKHNIYTEKQIYHWVYSSQTEQHTPVTNTRSNRALIATQQSPSSFLPVP